MSAPQVTERDSLKSVYPQAQLNRIRFIPNDDFPTITERELDQLDVVMYEREEQTSPSTLGESVSTSLKAALEQSRLLTFQGEQHLFKRLNFFRFQAGEVQKTLSRRRPAEKKRREIDRLLSKAAKARDELAHANLRLVVSIAGKLSVSAEEFDEFIAEGNGILLYAIDKFDFSRGYRFSTYLTHAIQRHLYRVINRKRKRLEREFASDRAIAANEPFIEPEPDRLTDHEVLHVATVVISRMDKTLTDREQFIIRGRFGLDGTGVTKPYRVLGEQLNLSKERVRQLFQQSISKLGEIVQPFESLFLTT